MPVTESRHNTKAFFTRKKFLPPGKHAALDLVDMLQGNFFFWGVWWGGGKREGGRQGGEMYFSSPNTKLPIN